ncbi:M61 family metallopeptidase [Hydrogenophilus thiooxidans]|uniref:M61 family metallopeptidase n=1 Tax=Hydrogenophilus thiooxidans TaxID=2820326 RepID=UPI001C2365C2|nr:PDZ domain-containing protein [Hydrogenophilus thiooxidans]
MTMLDYHVSFPNPDDHLIHVSLTFSVPCSGTVSLSLPVWIPGSYLVREFARHLSALSVTITSKKGSARRSFAEKVAKNRWTIARVAAGDRVTVCYTVWAYDLSVREAFLSSDRALLNGTSLFVVPESSLDVPCRVTFEAVVAYPEWTVATTLCPETVDARGFGTYTARNYHELVDTPVTIGPLRRLGFTVAGVAHELVCTGAEIPFDEARLIADLKRICQAQADFFGTVPFSRYLFHLHLTDDGYGGLEHRCSSVLLAARCDLPWVGMGEASADYLKLLGLFSHEYFHAWVVKRLRPRAYQRYDYFREQPTTLLWLFEGWTAYYDNLFLRRAGIIDDVAYLRLLSEDLTRVLKNPGNQVQPLADASFDAWIKFYRPHAHSASLFANYYTLGALVACALDWQLRLRGSSLDAVLLELWHRYGRDEQGVSEREIFAAVARHGGPRLARWLLKQVATAQPEPLTKLAHRLGLEVEVERDTLPDLGVRWEEQERNAGRLLVAQVLAGGAGERAGLAPRDEVIAVERVRVTLSDWEPLLRRYRPGDTVSLHFFREGVLRECRVTLGEPAIKAVRLTMRQRLTPSVAARRRAWFTAQAGENEMGKRWVQESDGRTSPTTTPSSAK